MEPVTLHSKKDFQAQLLKLIQPLLPLYSGGGALLNPGSTSAHYPDRVAGLEGFARVLWGLAPYWKGGGSQKAFEELYQKGLAAGTNPQSPEYWDAAGEANQRYVEMAAIALGLLLVPEKLWEPLSQKAKENLAAWLGKINGIDTESYPDCNWWFFVVLTNLALKKLGENYSPTLVSHALGRIESFYIGGGWYQDGESGRKDYYVSFAIHFYSLLYTVLEQEDPARCALYKQRADEFASDFLYWFDEKGTAVPYGRSLTYRFAQAAFWSAYVFAGLHTVSLPVVKGVLVRHLEGWLRQPVCDRDGVLTIGYSYPNLHMAETYNAPGSPYWAMKYFLLLTLPDAHPFWNAATAPMPPLEAQKRLAHGNMLVQRRGGHVCLYPDGLYNMTDFGCMADKYGKFVYSTGFGFSVAAGREDITLAAPDSSLAFVWGGTVYTRASSIETHIGEDRLITRWQPLYGIEVQTELRLTQNGHRRVHTVTNYSGQACTAYDCGFAIEAKAPVELHCSVEGGTVRLQNTSAMVEAHCIRGGGQGIQIIAAPNTNLLYTKTAIAAVGYTIPKGVTTIETEFRDSITNR